MKTKTLQLVALFFLGLGTTFAQDMLSSQVPSVIMNNFKKEFPKANDVEWERQGELYQVDFEIGWFTDYDALFNASGKLVKYTKEISKSDLPKAVAKAVKNKYGEYRIDDVKKIIENGTEKYLIDLEKWDEEFQVVYSKSGKLIL
ncbi:hypothetical protein RCH18_002507 [Flavobacterium sp. PL11]|jgi:hypothetical protein|uniref:PepSY-like domain-containing protein n=1 Tax=Flavobacterium sp. PL11 TaxID=3071717 RepID=UPI002DFE854E|nr:hypothetical protein [Flavobacterium sp. PL11]